MSWRVVARPEVDADVAEGATWYEDQQPGLGAEFIEEVFRVWDALAENPLLNSRRMPRRNIRWRYPERFPYRVIYEIDEAERIVIVQAVSHAARHDRHWHAQLEWRRHEPWRYDRHVDGHDWHHRQQRLEP